MTRIVWIENRPVRGWDLALEAHVVALRATPDVEVARALDVSTAPEAELYVVVSGEPALLTAEVDAIALHAPTRLTRTLLVGAPLDFPTGFPEPDPGTFAERLERHRLAGLLAPEAVLTWRPAPSWFAGPKRLLRPLGCSALKARQSSDYAVWFSAPGDSLADFLARFAIALGKR